MIFTNMNTRLINENIQFLTCFILTFICLIITIIYLWLKHRKLSLKLRQTSLLLCGVANSGKTLLFNRLISNVNKQTLNSMIVHHGTMTLDYLSTDRHLRHVQVIDLPSHSRQSIHNFHAYKSHVKGVIFVIDSTTIEDNLVDIGNYLYEILTDRIFREQHLNLLIFCNKQDLDEYHHHDIQTIRNLLENQLTKIFVDQTFQFDDINDIRIEFVEGSVVNTGLKLLNTQDDEVLRESTSQLLRVHQWIARVWFQ